MSDLIEQLNRHVVSLKQSSQQKAWGKPDETDKWRAKLPPD
jgi:hypothetical protein